MELPRRSTSTLSNGLETGDHAYQESLDRAIELKNEAHEDILFYGRVESRIKKALAVKNRPTAEEMAALYASGVTNIDDVPNHEELSKIFEELQITTELKQINSNRTKLKFFINEVYASFGVDSRDDESYAIYPAPAENGISFAVIIDILDKDGKHYLKKFALESGKVQDYVKGPQNPEFVKVKTFELSPKDIKSSEKVSRVKN